MTHEPLQHSLALAHASPVSAQNEGWPQIPLAQYVEQQSLPFMHVLPNVRQDGLSAAQCPLTHLRLQQLSSEVQVWPSFVHAAPQVPFTQRTLQQLVSNMQDAPCAPQLGGPWQVPLLPQTPGPPPGHPQQSDAVVHA